MKTVYLSGHHPPPEDPPAVHVEAAHESTGKCEYSYWVTLTFDDRTTVGVGGSFECLSDEQAAEKVMFKTVGLLADQLARFYKLSKSRK